MKLSKKMSLLLALTMGTCLFSSCDVLNSFTGSAPAEVVMPTIGANGNWYVNGEDTGKSAYGAQGPQGEKGEAGKDGVNGQDGKTPEFRVEGDWLQWKYESEGDTEWRNLYQVGGNTGTATPEGYVKLTYSLAGGVMPEGVPAEVNVTPGTSVALPTPKYQGYSFLGWYADLEDEYPVIDNVRVHENMTLYAKWEPGTWLTGKEIYTLSDLAEVKNNLAGHYILMNDIDCGGLGLPAIGTDSSSAFTGIFDGQGYTIKNYKPSVGEFMGLFGYSTGTIRNLNVENFVVEQKNSSTYSVVTAGGLVAWNGGVVEQCSAKNGEIHLKLDVDKSGGLLVGQNYGKVKNCYASGNVRVEQESSCITQSKEDRIDAEAGGIAGYNKNEIINCYVNAQAYAYSYWKLGNNYYASRYSDGRAGLIVGYNDATIQNCLVYGKADGNGISGDIFGYGAGTCQNCYKDEGLILNKVNDVSTYATAQSSTQLLSSDFYSISLGWSKDVWNYDNLSAEAYPTLKYNAK